MGNFYVNYTLRGPSQEAVAKSLAGRSAIVTPEQAGCVVVFDEESDTQNSEVISELGANLSSELNCPVLAVMNHDDDILWYQLYLNGELADEYNSSPGYFDPDAEHPGPEGGEASKLCLTFGGGDAAEVERILRKSALDEGGYVFAFERHADLVEALGISAFGVCSSFNYITENGELPDGLDEDDLIRVN